MRSGGGHFNPEWGYLAPAPSFMRSVRLVVIATAVGATAGAGAVLSLVDRPSAPGAGHTAVAAHALVTAVQAATPAAPADPRAASAATTAAAPAAAPASMARDDATVFNPKPTPPLSPTTASAAPDTAAAPVEATPVDVTAHAQAPAASASASASEAHAVATPQAPSGVAALAETPPAAAEEPARPPEQAASPAETAPKKTVKKRATGAYAQNYGRTRTASAGPEPLQIVPMLRRLFNPIPRPPYPIR